MRNTVIYGLVAVIGILLVSTLYFATHQKQAKAAPIVKITTKSSSDRVETFFKNRTKIKQHFNNIVWSINGQNAYESDLFLQLGITKASDKKKAREQLFARGYTRYLQTCYNMTGNQWSFGYCVARKYPEAKS